MTMVGHAEVTAQGPSVFTLILILWVAASSGYCFLHWNRLYPPINEGNWFRETSAMVWISGRLSLMPVSFVIVTVTATDLIVRLGLPQSVLFFFGAFCRDIVVPRSTIQSVHYGTWFPPWIRAVQVDYEDEYGRKSISLSVKEPQKLLLKLSTLSDD